MYELASRLDLGLSCPEDLFDLEFFVDDPAPFYKFAKVRKIVRKLYNVRATDRTLAWFVMLEPRSTLADEHIFGISCTRQSVRRVSAEESRKDEGHTTAGTFPSNVLAWMSMKYAIVSTGRCSDRTCELYLQSSTWLCVGSDFILSRMPPTSRKCVPCSLSLTIALRVWLLCLAWRVADPTGTLSRELCPIADAPFSSCARRPEKAAQELQPEHRWAW